MTEERITTICSKCKLELSCETDASLVYCNKCKKQVRILEQVDTYYNNEEFKETILQVKSIMEIKIDYTSIHSVNDCDCCGKLIGKEKLMKLPFLYLDCNDKNHEDLGDGYRQYYVCKKCFDGQQPREKNTYKNLLRKENE